MAIWEKLPEWARWILCWPVIFACGVVCGFASMFFSRLFLGQFWLNDETLGIIAPALATLITIPILYLLIYSLVPRKPGWITGFLVLISTVLGAMSVVRWGFELTDGNVEASLLIQDVLQTISAVGASWFWFLYLALHRL